MAREARPALVFLQVGTRYPLFIYCESPPLHYLFTVRDIPQNYLIVSSIVLQQSIERFSPPLIPKWMRFTDSYLPHTRFSSMEMLGDSPICTSSQKPEEHFVTLQ